jgi:outer membrane immunogenic protein
VLYGTGGFAYGQVEHGYSVTGDITASDSITKSQHGWTVGLGLEYALTERLTFKTEYLYVDLGKANLVSISPADDGFVLDAKTRFHTVKAGLNLQL